MALCRLASDTQTPLRSFRKTPNALVPRNEILFLALARGLEVETLAARFQGDENHLSPWSPREPGPFFYMGCPIMLCVLTGESQ